MNPYISGRILGCGSINDLIVVGTLLPDQLQRSRLEHLHGGNMNVAISDQEFFLGKQL